MTVARNRLILQGLTTTACGLACLASNTASAKDPCHCYPQDFYNRSARASVNMAFEAQAMQARILTFTLWNYHFQEDSEELRPSGRAQLDRLVRRYPFGFPEVYVQSAHDFRTAEGDLDAYFERRKELNELRTQAVSQYLQRVVQGQLVAVQIHDRPSVGMSGDETRAAYLSMITKAPSGLLPLGVTASRFEFGMGTGGGNFDFGGSGLNSQSPLGGNPFSSDGDGGGDSLPPPFSADVFSGAGESSGPSGGPAGPSFPPPPPSGGPSLPPGGPSMTPPSK